MNKDKKQRLTWVIGAIVVVAVALAMMALGRNSGESYDQDKMTLFYSDSCPHCETVEEFIDENNIDEKFDFQRLEVSTNARNSQRLATRAQICGLNPSSIGVPFLWTGEDCLMGDVDIIDYFQS